MRPAHLPARLLAETSAIVGAAVAVLAALLPALSTSTPWPAGFAALLVVLLAAPALYWRSMQALRQAAQPAGAPATPTVVPVERLDQRRRRAILATGLAQLSGIALTALAVWYVDGRMQADAQQHFERLADRLDLEVQRRFAEPVHGLKGVRAHLAVANAITPEHLPAYVKARDFRREFPGAQGVWFAERRAALAGDAGGDRYVVTHAEPLGTAPALPPGFDLAADAGRRAALERAVASGEPALLDSDLTPDTAHAPDFLIVLPVYRGADQPGTPPERHAALAGIAVVPVRTAELLHGLANTLGDSVAFELRASAHPGDAAKRPAGRATAFELTRALKIGGRPLDLHVVTTPAFDAALDRGPLSGVVLGGALLSWLLALVVWALSSSRIRAQTFAERMTADLDRLAQVVKHTDNSVVITDPALRITWVNDSFTHITGYTAGEARGSTPAELLASGKADDEVLQRLADAVAHARACNVEILNRAKDGREHWLDLELRPLFDADGALTGFMEIGRDVTERHLAAQRLEAALRENSALMKTIDQHALVGVCDGEGRLTHVNDAFCRVSGHAREDLIGRSHRFLDGGIEPRSFWEPVWAAVAAGRSWRGEVRCLARDGSMYWVDSTVAPMLDAQGRPERFITIRSDITASKRAASDLAIERERLQQGNRLLQAILDNLPCGLSVFDANMNLVVSTPQFRTLLDLPETLFETTPVPFERLARFNAERGEYGPGDADDIVTRIVEVARRPVAHTFERRRGVLTLEVRGMPMPGGGLVTTYTDITERKQAEHKMQRAQALLRGAIDAVNEAFVLYDADDRLVFCNDNYRQLYARSADLMVPGNTFEHIVRTGAERGQYPEAIGRVDDWVAERLEAHRRSDVSLVQRVDGGRVLRVVERRMADGHIVGFRIDITDLMRANEAAEAASRAKSSFVANMSHEIRTPMNAVLGMLQLLRRTELGARQRDYADKAERAARALLDLLNNILDFSKVEAGKLDLDPRPFSIDRLLRDLSAVVSANLGSKPVAVRFDVDPRLPSTLLGDDLRLQQVLVNLSGNAVKFTERGEVVVSVHELDRQQDRVRLEFAVRDTGIGIAPEQQQHIFDAFAQAEATTTRRFGGTGLGLSICQRLVALMGGHIRLDSAPGQGSRFSFELEFPVAAEAAADEAVASEAEASAPPGSAMRLAGLRLLVVEDNLTNQQVAEELLADEGATVHLASDGQQGVAAVAAAFPPYDAVLMDVQMPVMDGYTATAEIRTTLGRTALPVIAMTANALPGDREASLAAGMSDHVGKPFDLDELVATVLKHVGRPAGALPSAQSSQSSQSFPGPSPAPAHSASSPSSGAARVPLPDALLARAQALGIDLPAALGRLAGKVALWQRSAASFALELPAQRQALRELLLAGQHADAARALHTMKSVAATLGARSLAACAAQGESRLRNAPCDDAGALLATVEREIDQAQSALRQLVSLLDDSNGAAAPRDAGALAGELQVLDALLADADMAATDAFADIQARHEEAWGAELQALGEALALLDFEAARAACHQLRDALESHAVERETTNG
jgi:PAS domain S-box-containing protein